ncbi:unnamed protein product [Linum tenue]|uniref:RNase H type-1 domain-containing protein n=1 Tax=Linum tenue TaxID=586396 RepID=A0AAV0RKN7_9ROSI|nr:unnamed protein product [Linum tenue]
MQGTVEVEMGEALAAEFGAQLAHQLGYQSPILEMDSLSLVKKLKHSNDDHTEVGILCRRIVSLLQANGSNSDSIAHVRRTANNAAHIMAHCETHWDSREV